MNDDSQNIGIKVCAATDAAVESHKNAILQIITTPHLDQATIQLALNVLSKALQAPSNLSMNNNYFAIGQPAKKENTDE